MLHRLFCFLLGVLFYFTLHAQGPTPFFQRFTERDGLSNNRINCFLQDKQGFVWIGTQLGLNRYDGVKFTTYYSNRQDSTTLSDNIINALAEDKEGNIWIGTQAGGLNLLKKGARQFQQIKKGSPSGLQTDAILSLYYDGLKYLWIGYHNMGWSRLNTTTLEIQHGKPPITFINYWGENASHNVTDFAAAANGQIWMATHHGLFRYDTLTREYNIFIDSMGKYTLTHENLLGSIVPMHPDTLLLSTWGCGLKKFAIRSGRFSSLLFDKQYPNGAFTNIVKNVAAYKNSIYWVASADKGVGLFENTKSSFTFFKHDPLNPHSPLPKECRVVFMDRQQTLWAGFETGVATWSAYLQTFMHYQPLQGTGPERNIYNLEPLYYDASYQHLLCSRPLAASLLKINLLTHKESEIALPRSVLEAGGEVRVRKIDEIANQGLLIQTAKGWLLMKKNTGKIIPCELTWQGKKIKPVNTVIKQSQHQYALITDSEKRWYLLHVPSLTITQAYTPATPWPLPSAGNILLYEGDSIAYVQEPSTGFHRLRLSDLSLDPQFLNTKNQSLEDAISMEADQQGNYWISLYSRGICKLTKSQHGNYEVEHYSTDRGLPSNYTGQLVINRQNQLWLMTHKGLVTTACNNVRFKTYDDLSGYNEDWYDSNNPMLLHETGWLFTGHRKGLSFIRLTNQSINNQVPSVFITDVRIFGKSIYNQQTNNHSDNWQIPWERNSISFDFACNNYINPKNNAYAYRLIGFSQEWQQLGNTTTIDFVALRPGKYTFEIKASNNEGIWSSTPATFTFYIKPPFYASWWFIVLALCLLGGLAYLWYLYRIRTIKQEEILKSTFTRKMAEIEMKALRAQMNPHFIFNSLNSINRYIVKSNQATASGYLTRFAKLMRLILDSSATETTTLENEVQLLRLYIEMEQLRFEDAFAVNFVVEQTLTNAQSLRIPSMLIQPYVENAIWHGLLHKKKGGTLTVHFSKPDASRIMVVVADNGIGRQAANDLKHHDVVKEGSYGMQITGDRMDIVKLLYGIEAKVNIEDLYDAQGNAAGTRVTLLLPILIH